MDFLSRYDWITPTNPFAAIVIGMIFTIIITIVIWLETKETKTMLLTFLSGTAVTIIGVSFLKFIGFYG